MKQIWIVSGLVVAALGVSALIVAGGHFFGSANAPASAESPPLPWQVEVLPGGSSKVFGLTLGAQHQGSSTLADVRARWGDDVQIAIVAMPNEAGTLEAYVDPMNAGAISGKAVITAYLPAQVIEGMRERAAKTTYLNGTTRKATLSIADMAEALKAPVAAVSFIPAASLDEEIILTRFGAPTERVRINEHAEHFLYSQLGLDLVLDTKGKELLQYVAPANFERLRQPLRQAAQNAASAPAP